MLLSLALGRLAAAQDDPHLVEVVIDENTIDEAPIHMIAVVTALGRRSLVTKHRRLSVALTKAHASKDGA